MQFRHVVVWAHSRITGGNISGRGQVGVVEAGACSNPRPAPGLRERPLGHIDLVRYLLAEAEVGAGADVGVVERLYDNLTEGVIPTMEVGLRARRMEVAIAELNAERFAKELPRFYESALYVLREGAKGGMPTLRTG